MSHENASLVHQGKYIGYILLEIFNIIIFEQMNCVGV